MNKNTTEEIDFLELLASFYTAFKKNLLLGLGFPITGIIAALFFSYNSADLYESSILIETSLLSENECKFLFEQLDKFGVIPGLSKEQDHKIAGFKYEVIKNETPIPNGTISSDRILTLNERSVYLQLTARVYDEKVYPALQKAIVNFVNTSYPVTRHRSERERFYTEVITRIEKELKAMDQVKQEITSKVQATYLNPAELYAQTVRLEKEKTEYEIKREEIRIVHLIKGFDSLTFNAKMNKILVGIIGFAIGFAAFLFVLFIKFFAKYFTKYQKTH